MQFFQSVRSCPSFAPVIASAMTLTLAGLLVADDKRYVIIHADDAGMSHSVNVGTIEGLEKGVVSSASIMVPYPWFPEFAEYAKNHPEYDYGIHLTMNSEWDYLRWGPVAPREKVPSLVDEHGFLWDNVGQVAENVKAEEAEIELRAQIERAKQFGVPLSHLDTHMGALVSRPDLIEVYVKMGIEYDLPVLFVRTFNEEIQRTPALRERAQTLLGILDKQGLPVLDALYQYYSGGSHEQRRQLYIDALRGLKPGVSEIIIHCGVDNAELRAVTSSASNRDGDRRIFTEPEIAKLIKDEGIELLTWKQFHAMTRK